LHTDRPYREAFQLWCIAKAKPLKKVRAPQRSQVKWSVQDSIETPLPVHDRIRIILVRMVVMVHVLRCGAVEAEAIKGSGSCRDAVLYVLDKCGQYDVVLLGTKHKTPDFLRWV